MHLRKREWIPVNEDLATQKSEAIVPWPNRILVVVSGAADNGGEIYHHRSAGHGRSEASILSGAGWMHDTTDMARARFYHQYRITFS